MEDLSLQYQTELMQHESRRACWVDKEEIKIKNTRRQGVSRFEHNNIIDVDSQNFLQPFS